MMGRWMDGRMGVLVRPPGVVPRWSFNFYDYRDRKIRRTE